MILACKLLLAPGFVVLLTLAIRRFGPRIGGVLGGLPVVGGPILLVYALDHGARFAAHAAANSVAALVAMTAFALVVAFASARVGAVPSVLLGWAAFCGVATVVAALDPPPVAGVVAACLSILAALRVLPHPDPDEVARVPRRPPFDLTIRAGSAAMLVIVLTSLAGQLGPAASGALAMFPTITSVLIGFAVAHETRATTLHLLRGMLRGYFSFAAALFVLAVTLDPFGIALAFLTAIAATTLVQLGLITAVSRTSSSTPKVPVPTATTAATAVTAQRSPASGCGEA